MYLSLYRCHAMSEENSGNSKKERLQLSRDAKPKPLTKKERKEKRLKKRLKEEQHDKI